VTDQSGLTFDKAFTIAVTDIAEEVNHAPTNATLTGGTITENSANGTSVGTAAGVDPDAGAVLTYSLTDNAGGRFAINSTIGQITVANGTLLNYEGATSHDVTVRVIDQGGLTLDKVFTLNVANVNEAPTNTTLTGGAVAENATNGTAVGTVDAVDQDAGATLTYSLTDNAGGRFAINSASGQITVANFNSGNLQVDDFTDGSDKIDTRGTGITAATKRHADGICRGRGADSVRQFGDLAPRHHARSHHLR
jgi:hypothetical protein